MTAVLCFSEASIGRGLRDITFDVTPSSCTVVLGEKSSGLQLLESVLTGRASLASGDIQLAGVSFAAAPSRELKRLCASVQVLGAAGSLTEFHGQLAAASAKAADLVILNDPLRNLMAAEVADALAVLKNSIADSQLGWLLLTDDVSVAYALADHAVVLFDESVIESGTAEQVIRHAQHPYTQALISAVPQLDPLTQAERELVMLNPPTSEVEGGCALVARCPFSHMQCEQLIPELLADDDNHAVACFYPQERNVIVANPRRPHAQRPLPAGSLSASANRPDYSGPVSGRDFVSD